MHTHLYTFTEQRVSGDTCVDQLTVLAQLPTLANSSNVMNDVLAADDSHCGQVSLAADVENAMVVSSIDANDVACLLPMADIGAGDAEMAAMTAAA